MKRFIIKFVSWKTLIFIAVLLIIGGMAGTAFYFYNKYQKVKKNPDIISQEETTWLVEKVSKLMVLPSGTPTVATVLDKEKLKDQAFFNNSENGDKILVFMDAKKAILYRPSLNKIIEISPLVTSTARVTLLNGTTKAGVTDKAQAKIKDVADITITNDGKSAQNKTYTQTIVVDLAGGFSAQATQIASLLGGEVGTLPAGENKPDADIVVFAVQ
jgi:hypothetical protein